MKRAICLFLTLFLLLSCTAVSVFAEPTQQKEQTTRAIAVVFDNSGSMYNLNRTTWCTATYALEVFASMMNEGDTMAIYPMNELETRDNNNLDRVTGSYTWEKPLIISKPEDAEIIRYTYSPGGENNTFYIGTPIESIDYAYNGLKSMKAKEHWLLVVTDGDTFQEGKNDLGDKTKAKLEEKLQKYVNDVDVMYLGIGQKPAIPQVAGKKQYYSDKAVNSLDVLPKLSNMCNQIFGRDSIAITGDQFSVDISTTKLIAFVQGDSISNLQLSGNGCGKQTAQHSTHYPELGCGGKYINHDLGQKSKNVEDGLQGMMVTYEGNQAGSFTLNYNGTKQSVVVYYEPDVELKAYFRDENGNVIDPADKDNLTAGTYTLEYGLVDKNNPGKWADSDLLGEADFTVDYTLGGKTDRKTAKVTSGERKGEMPIELKAGDELDVNISVDYLSGYHQSYSGTELGFPLHINPTVFDSGDFKLTLTPDGKQSFNLSELETAGRYTLTATYKGEPLKAGTGADSFVANASVPDSNIGVDCVPLPDGSGYELCLKYHGDATQTDTGDFMLQYSVVYSDAHNESGESGIEQAPFTVINDGYGLQVDIEAKEHQYQLSKIEEGAPLILHLQKDGEPLTDEELRAVSLTITTDLPYDLTMLEGQSAFEMRLKYDKNIKTGSHKIVANASLRNSLGQVVEGEDKATIRITLLPAWLIWLIILGIILLIASIIWTILNTKVLPKRITVGVTTFTVDGVAVTGSARCIYSGGGKKRGNLTIEAPKCPTNPTAKCGFSLDLAAASPRRVKSASRLATVTGVNPTKNTVKTIRIGAHQFVREGHKFVKVGAKPNAPTTFEIGNRKQCAIMGETVDGTSISFTVHLKFL